MRANEIGTIMRVLGVIGGTSWHSTIEYYRYINETVNDRFGNNTNPPLILYNLNQRLVHDLQIEGEWGKIADLVTEKVACLQKGGAEGVILCANTLHKVFDSVAAAVDLPIIHICDATSRAISSQGISKVGLIGTRFTMQESFMVDRFASNGIEAVVPESPEEIIELHRVIQEELTFGEVKPKSKQFVRQAIDRMVQRGAQGVVLGCTEFPLMFAEGDVGVPTFNTTELHAKAATEFVLNE